MRKRFIKTLTIICVVTISGIVINSCCEGYGYKWTYILTDNLKQKEISVLDSIAKEEFGIRVHLFDRKYASNFQGILINQAYAAYDCWEIYTKEDSIISVTIKSMNKLTPDKDAFSDVTDLFLGYSEVISFEENEPITELISRINQEDMTPIDNLDLLYNSNQINDTIHQFVIEILLSDNRVLTDTTKPVRIY